MARYITKRVLRSLITMFIIITILFALLRLMPVEGYFENYDKMSSTQIQVKLQALGVTAPLPTQLVRFYKQVLHGENPTSTGKASPLPRSLPRRSPSLWSWD